MQILNARIAAAWLLASVFAGGSATYGQILESEPNNTCLTAQDLGSPALPVALQGQLLTPPDQPDVDFYRVSLPPGSSVRIELTGLTGGGGTLQDPYLGAFNSYCEVLQLNDDHNGLDSRIDITVPADGILTLGATACCDPLFTAGGLGTYTLTIAERPVAGPLTGRVVNANTGEPINGDITFASVQLEKCSDPSYCYFQGYAPVDGEGRFEFTQTYYGEALEIGDYRISVYVNEFYPKTVGPFPLTASGLDLGDVGLEPYRLIHSVSLRLIDALDGRPLAGQFPVWANVSLDYCPDDYCYTVAWMNPDEMGGVRFEQGLFSYNYLLEGNYRLVAFADQYEYAESDRFFVAEGEDFDFGDFRLRPLPIQVLQTQPCPVARQGGPCDFRVTLRNGLGTRFTGEAWVQVYAYGGNVSPYGTSFQVGKQGTVNPQAQKLNIKKGAQATLDFRLDAYAQASEGALFCASILVGRDPLPVLNVVGSRFLLCLAKGPGGYSALSEKEGRKKFQELKEKGSNR